MAFNFFQKKKDSRPDVHRGSKVKISDTKSDISLISKKEDLGTSSKKTAETPKNMTPHISEKSSNLIAENSYVFKIKKNLNKVIVKKAIENHYGIKVASVRILNTKPKKRMRGNIVGKKPGYKKAIAQLKEGYKIEF